MGWYVIITKATVPFATVIDYRQMFPHGQAPMPILTKLQKEKNKTRKPKPNNLRHPFSRQLPHQDPQMPEVLGCRERLEHKRHV